MQLQFCRLCTTRGEAKSEKRDVEKRGGEGESLDLSWEWLVLLVLIREREKREDGSWWEEGGGANGREIKQTFEGETIDHGITKWSS